MQFITLLSDLGDYSAGVAKTKSILMQELPDMKIIDVTHNIYPFYLQEAAYLLAASTRDFPGSTYHIVLFDLYYDKVPQLVLAEAEGQYILAPDNGILPLALGSKINRTWSCFEMNEHMSLSAWVNAIAGTIKRLNGNDPANAGLKEYELQNAPASSRAVIYPDHAECYVIHIDRYENIVLNITKEEFEAAANGRAFSIDLIRNETITTISDHYNSVRPGEKLCRFNSSGYLEVAINKGNASKLFGMKVIRERHKPHNTIKINFG